MTAEEANAFYCAQAARIVDTKGAICPDDRVEILRRIIASERERCAKIVEAWIECYPTRVFTDPPDGQHGATVDACSARAMRALLPGLAADIRNSSDLKGTKQ